MILVIYKVANVINSKITTTAEHIPNQSHSIPNLLYSTLMGPKGVSDAKKKKKPITASQAAQNVPSDSPINLDKSGNIMVRIHAKPGARANAITGITEEGVGVQINAPPVDGEANTELIKYISKLLGLRKSDVSLDKGFKSRQKTICISKDACSLQDVENKLTEESEKKG